MAKRSKKPAYAGKKQDAVRTSSDIDSGYISPITTLSDITFENVKSVLVHSRYAQLILILTTLGLCLRFYNLGFN